MNDPNCSVIFLTPYERSIVNVFNGTSYVYSGQGSVTGFNYVHLSDNLRWAKLSRSKWTNVLISMLYKYLDSKM